MGSSMDNVTRSLTNCIKMQEGLSLNKNYEQYDGYGNIVYYYKGENEWAVQKYRVYNEDECPIGLIQRTMGACNCLYTLIDENNIVTNYIDVVNNCTLSNYTFYDANRNIESVISVKKACCQAIYEEFDNYSTRINSAELNQKCCEIPVYYESDQNGNPISKIVKFNIGFRPVVKIFDANGAEINITNKTLVNKGFSRIQLLIILDELFYHQESSGD